MRFLLLKLSFNLTRGNWTLLSKGSVYTDYFISNNLLDVARFDKVLIYHNVKNQMMIYRKLKIIIRTQLEQK